MAIKLISKAHCPKCKARKAERLGATRGKSKWKCVECDHLFEISILKLNSRG